jgi:hypothetical protein
MKTNFNKLLAIHCHTTGLSFEGDDITLNNQALTVALGVVNLETLKFEATTTVKVKYDPSKYVWNSKVEAIHGISKEEALTGESLTDAAGIIGEFIYEHFGVQNDVPLFGYNVESFHLPFLNKILHSEDLHFKFDYRVVDLFTINAVFGKFSIREMFEFFGIDQSEPLSSLSIIKQYLKIFKTFKALVNESIG